jgi:hypothetical protein
MIATNPRRRRSAGDVGRRDAQPVLLYAAPSTPKSMSAAKKRSLSTIERYNRTLASEWAYQQVFTSNDDRSAALPDFLDNYNHRSADCHQPDGRVQLDRRRNRGGRGRHQLRKPLDPGPAHEKGSG